MTQVDAPTRRRELLAADLALAVVVGDAAPLVPGEEGLRDIRIVEAIMRSARTRAPVELTD